MTRLSPKQRDALIAVAAGRVAYGDPHPGALARRVAAARRRVAAGEANRDIAGIERPIVTSPRALAACAWLLDGHEAYGAENATYGSLVDRGLVDAYPNDDGTARTVTLTDLGRATVTSMGGAS